MLLLALGLLSGGLAGTTFESSQINFGVKALKLLAASEQGENVCISPYSIQCAGSLLRTGARGATDQELGMVLEHGSSGALEMANQISQTREMTEALRRSGKLHVANGLWSVSPVLPAFAKTAEGSFGAVGKRTTFPNPGLAEVNDWVKQNTNSRIPKILDRLDETTETVIANAVWFKDFWIRAFDSANTSDGPFQLPSGETVRVPTLMSTKMKYRVGEAKGLDVYELDMKGSELVIGLPEAGRTLSEALDSWAGVLREHIGLVPREGPVRLPKVRFESRIDLKALFHRMGMKIATSADADFTGLSTMDTFISQAVHRTYLEWDEEGAEAAAATAIVNSRKGISEGMIVDRPFLFAIKSGPLVLFTGIVNDPRR